MAARRQNRRSCKRPKVVSPVSFIICFGVLLLAAASLLLSRVRVPPTRATTEPAEKSPAAGSIQIPLTLEQLLSLSPASLQKVDVAILNLLCAQGLNGSDRLDLRDCLSRLDGIAERVKAETSRHLYKFRENPADFHHSPGFFRMLLLAVVLQYDSAI